MRIFRIVSPLWFALAAALPTFAAADEALSVKQLDPALQQALERALSPADLKALGYPTVTAALAGLKVSVGAGDCPAGCRGEVAAGMCYCKLEATGSCRKGSKPASISGADGCKSPPDTATLFASEGGLGTTRISIALTGNGG